MADERDSQVDRITRAVLYEGYSLYPYHRNATKNVKPVPFGVVYPQAYSSLHNELFDRMRTECVLHSADDAKIEVRVRFLHLRTRTVLERLPSIPAGGGVGSDSALAEPLLRPADVLRVGERTYSAGWEAVEREFSLGPLTLREILREGATGEIEHPEERHSKPIYDAAGELAGREEALICAISGQVRITASPVGAISGFVRVSVDISNTTGIRFALQMNRDTAYQYAFLSTHTIISAHNGEFLSVLEPEPQWKELVEQCDNVNTWPVLVDDENTIMLSSPIILYDHPRIAPESCGDLFDSSEIEEALLLHIAVLSDEEKKQIAQSDDKLGEMIRRAGSVTPEEMIRLHGGLRDAYPDGRRTGREQER